MKINEEGRELIKRWEGCRLDAYKCPAGVTTIGFGHTGDVKMGDSITQHQADVLLDYDLERFEEGVEELCPGLSENQFAACVSLAYNLGITKFSTSTLLRKLRSGDMEGASKEFMRWNLAAGKVQPGLVKRRAAEKALFLKS